jgi:hypothetical protein
MIVLGRVTGRCETEREGTPMSEHEPADEQQILDAEDDNL